MRKITQIGGPTREEILGLLDKLNGAYDELEAKYNRAMTFLWHITTASGGVVEVPEPIIQTVPVAEMELEIRFQDRLPGCKCPGHFIIARRKTSGPLEAAPRADGTPEPAALPDISKV